MKRRPVVVGVHGQGHDIAVACIATDGSIIHIGEEERYSRVKGSTKSLKIDWLFDVLSEAGVMACDVGELAVAGVPGLFRERRHRGARFVEPADGGGWVDNIVEHLPDLQRVTHVRHHVAHAASAAWCAPFERALVLTADGMGEFDTMTISMFEDFELTPLGRSEIPHSLGYLYRVLSKWAGMTGVEREGKFMGLAGYGSAVYEQDFLDHVVTTDDNGWPRLRRPFLEAIEARAEQDYLKLFFGNGSSKRCNGDQLPAAPHQPAADVAASVQLVLMRLISQLVTFHCAVHSAESLAVAGGIFMNSVLNGQLRREPAISGFFVQPMAGDNGLALGAALAALRPRRVGLLDHLYLGSSTGSPTRGEIESCHPGLDVHEPDDLPAVVANLICSGELVAVCRGRSEIGSRALGHRSVLGSATRGETGRWINEALKRREPWRPFAMTLLEEDTSVMFGQQLSAPFMMEVHELKQWEKLPSVAHVDRSTRPQTIARATGDPFLVSLLDWMGSLSGYRVVLNTSLNRNGEPIVRTWSDAMNLFLDCQLRYLVVDEMLVCKR
jgi:carbamoyltransferase